MAGAVVVAVAVGAVLALVASEAAAAPLRPAQPPQRRVVLLGLPQRGNPTRFATQVSNPSSPLYRRFLSLPQYDRRFASNNGDRRRVVRYLTGRPGVTSLQLSADKSV